LKERIMARTKLFLVVGSVALLAACEAKIGKDDGAPKEGAPTGAAAAEGKAEDGRFSIKGPGFDMKIAIPKGVADRAEVDSDSGLLYPGAALSGMHIEASGSGAPADKNSGVELRFSQRGCPRTRSPPGTGIQRAPRNSRSLQPHGKAPPRSSPEPERVTGALSRFGSAQVPAAAPTGG
jgi:hypothetical protein